MTLGQGPLQSLHARRLVKVLAFDGAEASLGDEAALA